MIWFADSLVFLKLPPPSLPPPPNPSVAMDKKLVCGGGGRERKLAEGTNKQRKRGGRTEGWKCMYAFNQQETIQSARNYSITEKLFNQK